MILLILGLFRRLVVEAGICRAVYIRSPMDERLGRESMLRNF